MKTTLYPVIWFAEVPDNYKPTSHRLGETWWRIKKCTGGKIILSNRKFQGATQRNRGKILEEIIKPELANWKEKQGQQISSPFKSKHEHIFYAEITKEYIDEYNGLKGNVARATWLDKYRHDKSRIISLYKKGIKFIAETLKQVHEDSTFEKESGHTTSDDNWKEKEYASESTETARI